MTEQSKAQPEAPQVSEAISIDPRLAAAIRHIDGADKLTLKHTNKKTGVVTESQYTKVSSRVEAFRKAFGVEPECHTEIIQRDDKAVVMRASIILDGKVVAMGHAEEYRATGLINRTSALENCETSAIGRALGNLGLHGGEYATAEETTKALEDQDEQRKAERHGTALPRGPKGGRPKPSKDAFVLVWPDGDVREFARSRRMIGLWLEDCLRATQIDADSLMFNSQTLDWVEETAKKLEKPEWQYQIDEIRDLAANPIEYENDDELRAPEDKNPVATGDPNYD